MLDPKPQSPAIAHGNFSLTQARRMVGDLFRPNMGIYWIDFLASILAGHACALVVRLAATILPEPLGWRLAMQAVAFVACCLLYYRAGLFIHDLAHLTSKGTQAFRVAWNLLAGIPFFMPSFTYHTHLDHHRRKHYGTEHDGEYLPFSSRSPLLILFYLAQALVIPALVFLRFSLVPLTWISPAFRSWLYRRASSLIIDPSYVRPAPSAKAMRIMRWQEAACFGWILVIFIGTAIIHRRLPYPILIQGYVVGTTIVFINSLRTLVAHRYLYDGRELSLVEQLVDSTNFPRHGWFNALWAPVGLRFHALHHLFPSMPYHNLGEAHRRLMAQLPADSPYRETEESSLFSALAKLWRRSRTRIREVLVSPNDGSSG
jgi:fatty acid desaturase